MRVCRKALCGEQHRRFSPKASPLGGSCPRRGLMRGSLPSRTNLHQNTASANRNLPGREGSFFVQASPNPSSIKAHTIYRMAIFCPPIHIARSREICCRNGSADLASQKNSLFLYVPTKNSCKNRQIWPGGIVYPYKGKYFCWQSIDVGTVLWLYEDTQKGGRRP